MTENLVDTGTEEKSNHLFFSAYLAQITVMKDPTQSLYTVNCNHTGKVLK